MHSKSLDFSQEQARIKAQGSIIQSHSSPHHAVCFSHLGRGGSYSPEKILHTFQNIQLRRAANAPWLVRNEVLHKDPNVPPLLDFIKKQSENFFNRLPQISNESIREIPVYNTILFLALLRDLEQFLITRINTSLP
ncbi:hypothetical protein TNCV_1879761 [Trichonephila clavipes]|nr:hypothetical protein TNCV_1879761 [Trichonephila clavipes]